MNSHSPLYNAFIHIHIIAELPQKDERGINKQVHCAHHSVHTQYYYVVNYWQEPNTGKHNATVGSNLKRKRCGSCQGCLAKDCMVCKFCHDKKKYGGLGKLKQCCEKKKCTTHVQEAKSKLPRIFQQPTAIHADPEPASTVEPPNKGHFGNGHFVLFSEAVPISEACHCLTI